MLLTILHRGCNEGHQAAARGQGATSERHQAPENVSRFSIFFVKNGNKNDSKTNLNIFYTTKTWEGGDLVVYN